MRAIDDVSATPDARLAKPSSLYTPQSDASQVSYAELKKVQRDQAFAYLIAVLLGIASVGASPEHLWWAPALVMLGYWGVMYPLAKKHHFELDFADSFYYMGFTLSVVALLASLHPFDVATDVSAKQELHFFGLGMLSTVVGVVGRTCMQLYHKTVTESAEVINQKMHSASVEYLSGLQELHRRSLGYLEELRGSFVGTSQMLQSELTKHLEQLTEAVRESKPKLSRQIDSGIAAGDRVSAVVGRLTEIHRELETWSAALSGQQQVLNSAQGEFQSVIAKTTESAASLRMEVLEPVKSIGPAIMKMENSIQSASDRVSQLRFNTEPAQQSIDALGIQVTALNQKLSEVSAHIERLLEEYSGRITALQQDLPNLDISEFTSSLADAGTAVKSFGATMTSGTTQMSADGLVPLTKELQQTRAEVQALKTVLDDIANAATVQLDRLAQARS